MTTRRSLTVVSPTFHPEPVGTPQYVTDLARFFDEHGWRVKVVTGQPYYPYFRRWRGYGRHTRNDQLGGIRIRRVPTIVPRRGALRWRIATDLNFAYQARRQVKGSKRSCTLTVSPGTPFAMLAAAGSKQATGPHVALVHDLQSGLASAVSNLPSPVAAALRRIEGLWLRQADVIFALSEEMRVEIAALGVPPDRIEVSPLWATLTHRPNVSEETTPSVQYSGSMGFKQGGEILPTIAAQLSQAAPDVRLLLRGAGPAVDHLRVTLESRSISNCDFEPPVPLIDLPDALAASPVHLVLSAPGTSRYVVPSKIVNSLAAGAAVVAMTDSESTVSRMSKRYAALRCVGARDADAAVREIVKLLRDPNLAQLRRQSQDQANLEFSRARVLAAFETRLSELVSVGPR